MCAPCVLQVCKAGLTNGRKIWLTRHGESLFNEKGIIGGDSSLSSRGERYAAKLPQALLERLPKEVSDECSWGGFVGAIVNGGFVTKMLGA